MKRILKWTAYFSVFLGVVLVGIFLLMQSTPVKSFMARKLSSALSTGVERRVSVGQIQGRIPFNMELKELTVADRQGTWLELRDINLTWSFWHLLRGRIMINKLSATVVDISRLPAGSREKTGQQKQAKPETRGFRIPPILSRISVENLSVNQLLLGESFIGRRARFSIEGRLVPTGNQDIVKAALKIITLDGGPHTAIQIEAYLSAVDLRVNVELTEQPAGLIGHFAALKKNAPIQLSFFGEGPPDLWKGRLFLMVGGYGTMVSEFETRFARDLHLVWKGKVTPEISILPSDLDFLGKHPIDFELRMNTERFRRFIVEKAELRNSMGELRIKGEVELDSESVDAAIKFKVHDLSVLEPLIQTDIAGGVIGELSLVGSFREPKATLFAKVRNLRWEEYGAGLFSIKLTSTPVPGRSKSQAMLKIEASGKVDDIDVPGDQRFPEKKMRWELISTIINYHQIDIQRINIEGEHYRVTAKGSGWADNLSGRFEARVQIADLEPLTKFFDQPVAGKGEIYLECNGDWERGDVNGKLTVNMEQLKSSDPGVEYVLGASLSAGVKFGITDKSRMNLRDIRLNTSAIQLSARAAINLDQRDTTATWHLSLTDLAGLETFTNIPLSGMVAIDGEISGPLQSLNCDIKLCGTNIVVDDLLVDEVTSTLIAGGVSKEPRGRFLVMIRQGKNEIKGATDFYLREKRLALNNLKFSAPGSDLAGDLTIDFNKMLSSGRLRGRFRDLGKLGQVLGMKLGGTAGFHLELLEKNGEQNIILGMNGKGLTTSRAGIQGIEIRANITDVFKQRKGSAHLTLSRLTLENLDVSNLNVEAEGKENQIGFHGELNGGLNQGSRKRKFSLKTRGEIQQASGIQLKVSSLEGMIGTVPIKLVQPFKLTHQNNTIQLSPTVIRMASGEIKASGSLAAQQSSFRLIIQHIPLELATFFGVRPMGGSADGEVVLKGSPASPMVSVKLNFDKISYGKAAQGSTTTMKAVVDAKISKDELKTKVHVSIAGGNAIATKLALPVKFVLSPWQFEVKPSAPVRGHIEGNIQLNKISELLLPEEQDMQGNLVIKIDLGGTLRRPAAAGKLLLRKGRYECATTGTVLDRITADIRIDGDRVTIEKFQALDGHEGSLTMAGIMTLSSGKHFPMDVTIKATKARLVHTDEVSAISDGRVEIKGNLQHIQVGGKITVPKAEIEIPEGLPPDVVDLSVIEVNGPESSPQTTQTNDISQAAFDAALDLRIRFPSQLYVRGFGLDSEWQGEINIQGNASMPKINGMLTVIRGQLVFFSRKFSLGESTIQLLGDYPPDPVLKIDAESKAKDIIALVKIRGTASSPEISIESDPPLPSDEVLAHLLFGKSARDISPFEAIQLVNAVNALAGRGEEGIGGLRKLLKLDEFGLGGGSSGSVLDLGNYLNKNIHLDVEPDITNGGGKATVNVQLTPEISIESDANFSGGGGVGLSWKHDY